MGTFRLVFRRLGALGAAASALLASGCVSSNLTHNSTVTSEVAEALPVGTPAPTLVVRAIWFPGATGADSADASVLGHSVGVLALAGNKLWFLAWNDYLQAYDVLHTVSFLSANRIRIAHFGLKDLLVIQSWNLSSDSFELMKGGSLVSDPETTRQLDQKLEALRAAHPQTDF
jgi:hypothetical protein